MNSTKALHPITISQSQVMFTRTVAKKQDISLNLKVPPPKCVHCTDINSTYENFVGFNKLYFRLEKGIKILLNHYPMQYIYANNLIHVGLFEQTVQLIILFWDTSIQGKQNLVPENVRIIFLFIR